MTKVRVIIADDERPAREYVKSLLREVESAELIGEAENGSDAVELIRKDKPDLVLLDIQMPKLSGIDVVKTLTRTETPLVAFITAFDEHAIQAFELNAVDYLLKPVERSRLTETINRAAERLEHSDWRESSVTRLDSAIETIEAVGNERPLMRIPVKEKDSIRLIPCESVASVTADGELLHIYTIENRRYTINFRLKDLEARLDPRTFVRVSRSAIVNLDQVSHFSTLPGGTYSIAMMSGPEITTSRLRSREIRNQLLKL